ncbi:MAG: DUF1800 domain-containing protein [Deltaproteobacteria bacterium]|nr:DUF1800 domain-containing protein [Deltaproteobacteria bacterium]
MISTQQALARFGLGARPGDAEAIRDPRDWLLEQLGSLAPQSTALDGLPSSADFIREWARVGKDGSKSVGGQWYLREVAARAKAALLSRQPFAERWVRHWANHFTVSVRAVTTFGLVGPFEREVVRARCLGNFADLLLASSKHPAMILYLDQQRSVGPASRALSGSGRRRFRVPQDSTGLNENLAREILELHTLGADGDYTQDDVRALAGLLTGWTFDKPGTRGAGFLFAEERHQPGTFTILGKKYSGGLAEGERALRDLARHPSTARNVARRLGRHFGVVDAPSLGLLEANFLATGGNLAALARTLVGLDAAWSLSPVFTTPDDWLVAVGRATGLATWIDDDGALGRGRPDSAGDGDRRKGGNTPWLAAMRLLGQPTWGADSPEGWPDDQAAWSGPEQVLRRVELAQAMSRRLSRLDREAWDGALASLGPRLAPDRLRMVERAGDRATAYALLFLAPEVLRR